MTSEVRPFEVKHLLHKDVFHPKAVRLIGFTKVLKTQPGLLSKENVHYLCSCVTVKRPYQTFICRYRKRDNGEGYEERRNWPLQNLKKVDCHSAAGDSLLFDLYFDRAFKFQADTQQGKDDFIESLIKLSSKYLTTPPPLFIHTSSKTNDLFQKHNLSQSATSDLTQQVAKTKQQLDERGERLNELQEKTADLEQNAQTFLETTKKINARLEN